MGIVSYQVTRLAHTTGGFYRVNDELNLSPGQLVNLLRMGLTGYINVDRIDGVGMNFDTRRSYAEGTKS